MSIVKNIPAVDEFVKKIIIETQGVADVDFANLASHYPSASSAVSGRYLVSDQVYLQLFLEIILLIVYRAKLFFGQHSRNSSKLSALLAFDSLI